MSQKSKLLTLPLELRQHMYSYLLINKYPKVFLRGDTNFSAHSLSITCRQLYSEVLDYYYDNNIFQLSLTDPHRFPSQVAACSKTGAEYLEKHLKRVQNLQLEIELFDGEVCDPLQEEQPEWFCSALLHAKQGFGDENLLKSLTLQVRGPLSWDKPSNEQLQQGTDEEMARYKSLLQPLKGKIGKLTIFDREVTLTDEDVNVDHGTKTDDIDDIPGDYDL